MSPRLARAVRLVLACASPVLLVLVWARAARAADLQATPATVDAVLAAAKAGDTVRLAAGTYAHFSVSNLNGTATAWITITGPVAGAPAIVAADPGPCCNTIEVSNSSYVAIERLTIDGENVDGAFGVSAKSGIVHHIRIEDCDFINHHGSQQHNAISTKVTTWGWVIRNNRITDAGTGIYLGNSNGAAPFIGGLIEGNVIKNPIGYCAQIKHQLPRTSVQGMPTEPLTTVIRRNVFVKNDAPSPDGNRPNLLVGGFPETGPGSSDRYEIYANLFVHNARESLLQASGRVTIHDNIFVDAPGQRAILLADHDLPLKLALVYDNTIYAAGTGIQFGSGAPQGDAVVGNLIFAETPIAGTIAAQHDNLTDKVTNAATYVNHPSTSLGQMDFYPLIGQCRGAAVDPTPFVKDLDYAVDYNGNSRGSFVHRGAYAGEGKNPGGPGGVPTPDAGTPAGALPGGDGASAGPGENGNAPGDGEAGGCTCESVGTRAPGARWWVLGVVAAVLGAARRARRQGPGHR